MEQEVSVKLAEETRALRAMEEKLAIEEVRSRLICEVCERSRRSYLVECVGCPKRSFGETRNAGERTPRNAKKA